MEETILTVNVYGDYYTSMFFNYCVPSIINQEAADFLINKLEFLIFTKKDWVLSPQFSNQIKNLRSHFKVRVAVLPDLPPQPFFENRYTYLAQAMKFSIQLASEEGKLLSTGGADYVYGATFWANLFKAFYNKSLDGILSNPIRSVAKPVCKYIDEHPKLSANELFRAGFENLAPIWISSYWSQPRFTPEPFQLLWHLEDGFLLHNLGWSIPIFRPTKEMANAGSRLTADHAIPQLLKSPMFSTSFSHLPWLKLSELDHVYHLFEHPSVFGKKSSNVREVAHWLFRTSVIGNKNPFALTKMLTAPCLMTPTDPANPENSYVSSEVIMELSKELSKSYGFNVDH